MDIKPPYLLFLENAQDELISAKTAYGIYYWRPELCLGQLNTNTSKIVLDLPKLTLEEAINNGAKSLILGIANFGGKISSEWIPILKDALKLGLDIVSGLHEFLKDIPELSETAKKYGRKLIDLRYIDQCFPHATGKKRKGKRLLTIGTDCGVGKMFTALAIEKELHRLNYKADFRATGQTGILIATEGLPFDAIKSDFVAGAMETLSPDNEEDHWDIIEGQGSILHPACGVVLALLHGSQPDAIVLCHEATREYLYGYPHYKTPELDYCLRANLEAIRLTNSDVVCVGISINSSRISLKETEKLMEFYENKLNLPCVDPVKIGVGKIINYMEKLKLLKRVN